jgi:hypothetical protein
MKLTRRDLIIGGPANSGGLYLESGFVYVTATAGDPNGFKGNRNYYASSDDRMKFNETPIAVIPSLGFKIYNNGNTA